MDEVRPMLWWTSWHTVLELTRWHLTQRMVPWQLKCGQKVEDPSCQGRVSGHVQPLRQGARTRGGQPTAYTPAT